MLLPECFLTTDMIRKDREYAPIIDNLNAYARSNPSFFITISDIEKFTNLSTRSLQYAFNQVLNMTPSQWLRRLKMNRARDMLIASNGKILVTEIAMEFGFTNFSLFSKQYREIFNELPSETLKKIRMEYKSI